MPASTRRWTAHDVPDQVGRVALVTGANSGIGLEAASLLAQRGARVLLACRSADKAARAAEEIRAARPLGDVEALQLDLASLASVREAALQFQASHNRLDLLINNAGIMAVPVGRTAEGFELQFGTNHLGHFALTGLVLERLLATPDSRVVTISSGGHRMGKIDFQDLNWERGYGRWRAYGRSKLANLLFTYELQRRLEHSGSKTIAVAAHPGGSATNLGRRAPGEPGAWVDSVIRPISGLFLQSAAMGALPTLRAATDPHVVGGEYYGPSGPGELRGLPVRVTSSQASRDPEVASRLWAVSEELTEVRYTALEPSAS
jgi:NAD(P)-dependent dehydrogenase (short-subunit alcohol dehydrogenase family)